MWSLPDLRHVAGTVDLVFFPCLVAGWTGAPTINSSVQPALDGSHSQQTTVLVAVGSAQPYRSTLFSLFPTKAL